MPRDQDANDRTMVERIDPLLGSVLDRRYMIDFRLAAGGFGAIYRATHIKSGHEVALKVLHPQLTGDAGVVARFRREGATMTSLRSPHTITAYELGEADDGTLYIVMELLRGESLFERFRSQGRFEWKRMVKIARAICDSLGEAHARGIVHRDLKPTNIHLEPAAGDPDFVKVLDFGIAKILHDSDFDSSDLTNAGQMIGTLDYMSPEQMVGGACTGQSDIYTLGILIYELIAGVRPFAEAQTAAAALAAILKTTPPPLSKRTPVPEELDRILARCLERDPLKRYKTVGDLEYDLRLLLSTQELDDVTRTVAFDPMEVGAAATLDSIPPMQGSKLPTTVSAASQAVRPKVSMGARSDMTDPYSLQPTTPNAVVPRAEDSRQSSTRTNRVAIAASDRDR
ncbi:MAG: serine/threonine protein kinase, partial [Deltaproteobacteria bacterium]|nr:serine/threonine protein kinase [Deltaproteobacteria bacterium]